MDYILYSMLLWFQNETKKNAYYKLEAKRPND